MKTITYLITYEVTMKNTFTFKGKKYESGKPYRFTTKTTDVDYSPLSAGDFFDCAIDANNRKGFFGHTQDPEIIGVKEIELTPEERAAKLIIPGVSKEITIDIEYDNLENLMQEINCFMQEINYDWEKGAPNFLLPYGYSEYEYTQAYAHYCFVEGRITPAEMVDLIFKPVLSHGK